MLYFLEKHPANNFMILLDVKGLFQHKSINSIVINKSYIYIQNYVIFAFLINGLVRIVPIRKKRFFSSKNTKID